MPVRSILRKLAVSSSASCVFLLTLSVGVSPIRAQVAQLVACPPLNQDLITVPEIRSRNGRLRAVLTLTDEKRTLWGSIQDTRCAIQDVRFFKGSDPASPTLWPATGEPIPGPTFRARVGDLVEIAFLNQIDTQHFAGSLDEAKRDDTTGCDQFVQDGKQLYPNGDKMPNCLHGSSTANVHFHGTHTTPNTTGDNVLLYVRPALREGGRIEPSEAFVHSQFTRIFRACEQYGTPARWRQLPPTWRDKQELLLKMYDNVAVYQGQRGHLPEDMKIWPPNQLAIAKGQWPPYHLGAYPYCFRLPAYNPPQVKMGQAPGTHWYHAHKHGSSALNVSNGMTGAFIVEGQYDADLRKLYGSALREQVLMLQQLSTAPFPLLLGERATKEGRPPLSVNGRRQPVITMRPNEVQLWRLIDGAFRDAVMFQNFTPQGSDAPCSATTPPSCVDWRQIAQDGVQFKWENYVRVGSVNRTFNLAPGNRADLLVRAPGQTGTFQLNVRPNVAENSTDDSSVILLTVKVEGQAVNPPMDFIEQETAFPGFPKFLADITEHEIHHGTTNELVFGRSRSFTINGHTFNNHAFDQTMELNSAEEWKVSNQATDISHPFHIHINPFQIVEVFQPNSPAAQQGGSCYADPTKPETWKPCQQLQGPFVWWDTFAIPLARDDKLDPSVCTTAEKCPANIRQYVSCSGGSCTVTIPGYFKMRSRFVDFPGQFVLHCHILIHEDRGMMQLVQIVPKLPLIKHD